MPHHGGIVFAGILVHIGEIAHEAPQGNGVDGDDG
jgi:hypothetical protein